MGKCPICKKEFSAGDLKVHMILEELAVETIKEVFPRLANKLDVCLRYYHHHRTQAKNKTRNSQKTS